jgi:transcriptional regulator with XRE-family HTH domain
MVSSFGPLLRRLRQESGLTIEELSHASGVSVRAIGDMERGVSRSPQRRTVQALAEALRVDEEQRAELAEAARVGRPRLSGPVTGAGQLPRGTGDFVGRLREFDLLRDLAEQAETGESAVVATISGPAGIGKTALAVHATRHLGEAFPDGCFYVDLRGMDSVPLAPGAVHSRLLKALGVVEREIPSDEDERAGLYRAVLGHRRCLIVLDNAADEAQVRPLLPARGPGMTIVTSRRSLAGLEGVRQIPLDQLSSEEAGRLLRAIVGKSVPRRIPVAWPSWPGCVGTFRWRCGSPVTGCRAGLAGRSASWRTGWAMRSAGWRPWRWATWPWPPRSRCPTSSCPVRRAARSGGWRWRPRLTSGWRWSRCWPRWT